MGAVYGFKPWDIIELSRAQVAIYLRMLGNVTPFSKDFGKPPAPTYDELRKMGTRVGMNMPATERASAVIVSAGDEDEDGDVLGAGRGR